MVPGQVGPAGAATGPSDEFERLPHKPGSEPNAKVVDMSRKHGKATGTAAAIGRQARSGARPPHLTGSHVPNAATSLRLVAGIARRHPAVATSPLLLLARFIAACDLLAEYGFVRSTNVCLAMGLAAKVGQAVIESGMARGEDDPGNGEAEGVAWQRTSELLAGCEFEGEFEGHTMVGLLGDGVPWREITILLDDRLAYRISCYRGATATEWRADRDTMPASEAAWLLSARPEGWEYTDVPESLAEAFGLAHRFRDAVFATLGIEAG
jgi:hypothetical protein